MSRLAKQPIVIPSGVECSFEGNVLNIKGPKGKLSREFKRDIISIEIKDGNVVLENKNSRSTFARALLGTYASHIRNMIYGVQNGYEKKLIVEGVGFRSEVKGKELHLTLGFSHPVIISIPEDLEVSAEKNVISVKGIDKEKVGQFAAKIRAKKKPEPYKGKGIRYEGEVIRRKQGKKSA